MAPKRKRPGDRGYSQDNNDGLGRPSPHRPQNLSLAQQNPYQNTPQRGGRRISRGGSRGGHNATSTRGSATEPSSQTTPTPSSPQTIPPPRPSTETSARVETSSNPTQQTPTSTGTLVVRPESTMTLLPLSPTYLTNEVIQAWQSSGKRAIVSTVVRGIEEGDISMASAVFQELLKAAVTGQLDATEAGLTVQNILSESTKAEALDLPALFLDQFSEVQDEEIRIRPSIRTILRAFLVATNISPSLMRELLGSETLGFLNLTRPTFQGMTVRHSTNVLYRQSAFNLLREETEGYSKLITEYFTAAETTAESTELPWTWVTETWEKVKALIGAFNMDPGRVLDVTLDVFANLLIRRNVFFIKLLRASSWWPQRRRVEGVEVEHDNVSALPSWAEPGSDSSRSTHEEREQIEMFKQQRDVHFWPRVRQKGMAAFLELGGHRILSGEDKAQEQLSKAQDTRKKEEEIEDMEINAAETGKRRETLVRAKEDKTKEYMKAVEDLIWITTTNTYPASGNRTAAQILGFKLRFYASSARDKGDVLHETVIYLAALLIKIGFISLRDLYPHLYPYDEDMPAMREKLEKEKEERDKKSRAGGTDNALARSAPLFDDTLPVPPRLREPESRGTPSRSDPGTDKISIPPKTEAEEKEKLSEPADQKIPLLKSLLLIGAIPESLYILSRFPWLLDLHPDIPRYVNRLLRHSLDKLYENLKAVPDEDDMRSRKQVPSELQTNDIKTKITPPKKSLKWAQFESLGVEIDYNFYWAEWADHIPVCQTVDDVFLLCGTLLNLVGVKIGQDTELLMMLIRIGRKSLGADPSEKNRIRWIDLSKRLLFPALSFTKDNPNVDTEMHRLLREFSLESRYNIYAECYTGQTSRLPAMRAAFDQAKAETKAVLKRINKKNTKQMARALAKPVCANPGIVFQVALNQLESYQNLIDCFVECGKYFSDLGYEVLVWSLLTALGGAGRNRMQADGMLTSPWLKALSVFTGRIFQKYSAMKIDPLLQYLASQLQMENSTDLEILQETLLSMGGIISDTTYGEDQVLALAGGPLLRDQTLKGLLDNRHGSRSSARRLMDALMRTNLAAPILILIAQERRLYAHRNSISDAPLKVLGNNLDKIHRAFGQYLEFLRSNMSTKDFDNIVPNIGRLIADFDLDAPIAFEIFRPSIKARLASIPSTGSPKEGKQGTPGSEKDLTDVDVPMLDALPDTQSREARIDGTTAERSTLGPTTTETNVTGGKSLNIRDSEEVTMEDIAQPVATPAVADTDTHTAHISLHPVLTETIKQLQSALPDEMTSSISMLFFLRFWSMSLYDVTVPSQGYSTASQDITARVKKIQADRKDLSVSATKKREEEKATLLDLQGKIQTEFKRHIEDHKTARVVLSRETDRWFIDFPSYEQEDDPLSTAIVTHCFLPRLSFSAMDAKFVAKFIFEVHSLGTRGFRTSRILDCILREKKLSNFLIQCTETEAENLGIFLNDILYKLRSWHQSKEQYEKEAWGKKHNFPGFAKECNEDKSPKGLISYEDFRRDLFKWHGSIHAALKACLTSGDDTHIRNAIKCLMNMRKEFPAITFHGKQTLDTISTLAEKESREDLKRMTQMAQGGLKQMEKKWVMPQAFRLSEGTGQKESETSNRSGSVQPGTPQSAGPAMSFGKTLDVDAPESHPKLVQANGIAPTSVSDKMEVEDGEVEDEARKGELPSEATTSNQTGLAPLASQTHAPQGQPAERASESISKTPEPRSRTPQPNTQSQARTDTKTPSSGATTVEPKLLSRPGTPASSLAPTQRSIPIQSSGQHRLEPSRPLPSQYPPRSMHALPGRPEIDVPRERISHRVGDRLPNYPRHSLPQDARRGMVDVRLDRPDDFSRVGSRGRGRDRSPNHLSRQRTPERLMSSTHDNREVGRETSGRDPTMTDGRFSRQPSRETRSTANLRSEARVTEPIPPPRDRFNSGPRTDEPANRDSTAVPFEPSQVTPSGQDRALPINAGRASLMQGRDRSDRLIPDSDRSVDRDIRRLDAGRDRDAHQRLSRPHSPLRRGDDQTVQTQYRPEQNHDQQRDSRAPLSDRGPAPVHPSSSHDRHTEPTLPPPSGPRSGRVLRPGPLDLNNRSRDPFQPARTVGENAQSLHPERDFAVPSRPQDPGYASVNAPPDIPSGPRGRGRGRNPSRDFRFQETVSPHGVLTPLQNTDRQPFPRHSRRPSDSPQTLSQSVPQSPAADRNGPDTADVHPSRLPQIEGRPQRTEMPSSLANLPPSSAPSGPRGNRPSSGTNFPTSSPTGRNPPSGPMSATERRQQDDRRFANIQNTLAQAGASPSLGNDRAAPNRGRGSNTGPPTPPNTTASLPPLPTSQPPSGMTDGPPTRLELSSRRESLRSRAGLEGSDDRPDSRNSRRGEEGGRSLRRHRSVSPRREERTTDFRQRDSERTPRGPPANDASKERDMTRENENGDDDRDGRESRRGARPREDLRERDRDRTRERDHGRELRDREGRRDTRGPPHPTGPSRDDAHRNGAPLPPHRFPLPHGLHGGPPIPTMHHGRHLQWESRGPPGPTAMLPMPDPMRNGELRTPRGSLGGDRERRDERDDRGRGGMSGGRDSSGRKRGRGPPGPDDGSPVESKRPRRGGA